MTDWFPDLQHMALTDLRRLRAAKIALRQSFADQVLAARGKLMQLEQNHTNLLHEIDLINQEIESAESGI